jgi:hypothetical protein
MNSKKLQAVIASRLEDLADQCQILFDQGNFAEAELLREEGLALAKSYDDDEEFFYVGDLKTTR